MAQPLAIYRKASLRFAVANFCVFAGFATSLYRDQSDPVVFWLASDVLILFAVFFYKKATYRLFKLNNNGLFDHALLLATAFCVAVTLIFDMDYLKVAIVLTALAPFEYQGNAIPITISVGVCAIDKANDVKTLIAMADKALYQAKHEGRNRTVDAAPIQP